MIQKFLTNAASGLNQLLTALTQSTGPADGGKVVATDEITGKLHTSLLPTGVGPEIRVMAATEALSAGDIVNIYNDAGEKCRKADATGPGAGKMADGFVLAGCAAGEMATVYMPGHINDQMSGLTVGALYFLDTTAGGITATPPNTTGNIVQLVGKAWSPTELMMTAAAPVLL